MARTVDWFRSEISNLRFEISEKSGASGISETVSEQTLTAARPSRILTAFPFEYFKARRL
jgi:hypothetical protein